MPLDQNRYSKAPAHRCAHRSFGWTPATAAALLDWVLLLVVVAILCGIVGGLAFASAWVGVFLAGFTVILLTQLGLAVLTYRAAQRRERRPKRPRRLSRCGRRCAADHSEFSRDDPADARAGPRRDTDRLSLPASPSPQGANGQPGIVGEDAIQPPINKVVIFFGEFTTQARTLRRRRWARVTHPDPRTRRRSGWMAVALTRQPCARDGPAGGCRSIPPHQRRQGGQALHTGVAEEEKTALSVSPAAATASSTVCSRFG